jgi:hypothetical protein
MSLEAHPIDVALQPLSSCIYLTLLCLITLVLWRSTTLVMGFPVSFLFVISVSATVFNTLTRVRRLVQTNTPQPFNTWKHASSSERV